MERKLDLPDGIDDAAVAELASAIWKKYITEKHFHDELIGAGIDVHRLSKLPNSEPSSAGEIIARDTPISVRRTKSGCVGVETVIFSFVTYVGVKLVDKFTDRALDKFLDDYFFPEIKRIFGKKR